MFNPTVMDYHAGKWVINAAGRKLAKELADGCEPLRAKQSAILWAEVARLTALNGKGGQN